MASASTGVNEFDSVVRGHHIYKLHGLHPSMTHCKCKYAIENWLYSHRQKGGCIVEYISREISMTCSLILTHDTVLQLWHLNGLLHLFHSFYCTTQCVF